MSDYEITETELDDNAVRWTAEDDEGNRIGGIMTRWRGGTKLTDSALEDLADKLIGQPVEVDESVVAGNLKEYSIAGDFGE